MQRESVDINIEEFIYQKNLWLEKKQTCNNEDHIAKSK